MEEVVVLVDEHNTPLGVAPKDSVHTTDTPLHRGFSLFLFNAKKQLLVTRRSQKKKTFPGVWTNTVCGHPGVDESAADAAKRRLAAELGIHAVEVREVAPYRYRCSDASGIVENEICPVLVGTFDADPTPNPKEVREWKWMDWNEFVKDSKDNPQKYSPWCREEVDIIASLALP